MDNVVSARRCAAAAVAALHHRSLLAVLKRNKTFRVETKKIQSVKALYLALLSFLNFNIHAGIFLLPEIL